MGFRLPTGFLVVFEGIDGAGKTTQATLLAERLREDGIDVVPSKEPTWGPWGQKIRDSSIHGRLPPEEELEAFIQDRKEHVRSLLRPALERGQVVILDRYYFSTAAYQGAQGIDPDQIIRQNEAFAPPPDLLIILDIPESTGAQRITDRGDQANLFEGLDSLRRCREIFRSIQRPGARHFDGTRPPEELADAILTTFRHAAWQKLERSSGNRNPQQRMEAARHLAPDGPSQ